MNTWIMYHMRKKEKEWTPKVGGLFAGVGGIELGFEKNGFKTS